MAVLWIGKRSQPLYQQISILQQSESEHQMEVDGDHIHDGGTLLGREEGAKSKV